MKDDGGGKLFKLITYDSLSLKANLIDNYEFDRFFYVSFIFLIQRFFLLSITMEA